MDPFLVDKLTDEELFEKLKFYKINCGPVQPTTRALYENRLKKHLKTMKIPGDFVVSRVPADYVAKSREPPLPSINGISPIRLEPEIKKTPNVQKQTDFVFIKQEPTLPDRNQKPDIIFESQTTPKTSNKIPPAFKNQYEHRPVPQQSQYRPQQQEPELKQRPAYETQYRHHEPPLIHRPPVDNQYRSRESELQFRRQPQLFSRDPPVRQSKVEFKLLNNLYNQPNSWDVRTEENFASRRLINLDTDALFKKHTSNSGSVYDEPAPPQPRYNQYNSVVKGSVDSQSNLTRILMVIVACFILVYGAVTFLNSSESTVEIY